MVKSKLKMTQVCYTCGNKHNNIFMDFCCKECQLVYLRKVIPNYDEKIKSEREYLSLLDLRDELK